MTGAVGDGQTGIARNRAEMPQSSNTPQNRLTDVVGLRLPVPDPVTVLMPPFTTGDGFPVLDNSGGTLLEWLDDVSSIDEHFAALDRRVRLVISISTRTAFTMSLAELACRSIGELLPDRFAVETALTEAISNALIHGNLVMPTFGPATDEAHRRYLQQIDERLANPDLAARRVTVGIDWDDDEVLMLVIDSGAGYTKTAEQAIPGRGGGMGFTIIRSLTTAFEVRHGGRRIDLHFSRKDPPA